jgi:cyclopropane fatty-acyl-phospholipid synthase-like methyltransferase
VTAGRLPLVDRVQHILDRCRGRRVLHLGCTNWPYTEGSLRDGSLLHLELNRVAAELWGLDRDQAGLDVLAGRGVSRLVRGDLEALDQVTLDRSFDVIVAGEIIEHLSNPGRFLTGVQHLMRPDTLLLITTINAYGGVRMAIYALRGRGGRQEPVHPDHVAYYSYSTLQHLVRRHHLEIARVLFYDIGPEHRVHNRFYINWINDLAVLVAHQLADGLIVECRLPGVT